MGGPLFSFHPVFKSKESLTQRPLALEIPYSEGSRMNQKYQNVLETSFFYIFGKKWQSGHKLLPTIASKQKSTEMTFKPQKWHLSPK